MAERAVDRAALAQPRLARRGNREKELFALRAQHVKTLFRTLEALVADGQQGGRGLRSSPPSAPSIPKNLGGIEVPDGARLVLKFLERRVECVISPLVNIGGRPVPLGALASCSVIQYDPADPAGADWYDLSLREDGSWLRKGSDGEPPQAPLGEREMRGLVEWLVG